MKRKYIATVFLLTFVFSLSIDDLTKLIHENTAELAELQEATANRYRDHKELLAKNDEKSLLFVQARDYKDDVYQQYLAENIIFLSNPIVTEFMTLLGFPTDSQNIESTNETINALKQTSLDLKLADNKLEELKTDLSNLLAQKEKSPEDEELENKIQDKTAEIDAQHVTKQKFNKQLKTIQKTFTPIAIKATSAGNYVLSKEDYIKYETQRSLLELRIDSQEKLQVEGRHIIYDMSSLEMHIIYLAQILQTSLSLQDEKMYEEMLTSTKKERAELKDKLRDLEYELKIKNQELEEGFDVSEVLLNNLIATMNSLSSVHEGKGNSLEVERLYVTLIPIFQEELKSFRIYYDKKADVYEIFYEQAEMNMQAQFLESLSELQKLEIKRLEDQRLVLYESYVPEEESISYWWYVGIAIGATVFIGGFAFLILKKIRKHNSATSLNPHVLDIK